MKRSRLRQMNYNDRSAGNEPIRGGSKPNLSKGGRKNESIKA
jgi:hypothetical protein